MKKHLDDRAPISQTKTDFGDLPNVGVAPIVTLASAKAKSQIPHAVLY